MKRAKNMANIPFTQTIQHCEQLIQAWSSDSNSRFSAHAGELHAILQGWRNAQQRFAAPEELRLRIGIMGQVKAGKSTFLNALLFDGKPILPQAATPKTANLTRISYGEQWQLIVEYYTPEEWDELRRTAQAAEKKSDSLPAKSVEPPAKTTKRVAPKKTASRHAASNQTPAPAPAPAAMSSTDNKVACELLALAHERGLGEEEIKRLLAKGQETITVGGLDELMTRMNDYVGNDGHYTPLVKMSHLLMPLPELQGFDVVDTPGMNDPVRSRTEKTKDEMLRCDVVFFLTRTSQFLEEQDIALLKQQIPQGGVSRIVLVGGQLDSTVLEAGYDRDNLNQTLDYLRDSLAKRATAIITPAVQGYESMGKVYAGRAAALRRMMAAPILSSTFAHGFATWPREQWERDNAMRHAYAQINNLARQSWGQPELSHEQWLDIANFTPLRNAYEDEKRRKEQTLQEKKANLEQNTRTSVKEILTNWHQHVGKEIEFLRDGDLVKLNAEQQRMQHQLQNISTTLGDILGKALQEAQQKVDDLHKVLQEDVKRGAKLHTRQGTETYEKAHKISTVTWWKPWTWLDDDEIVWKTYTRNYEYIAVDDAIESAQNYERRTAQSIERGFNQLLSKRTLIRRLREALESVLDSGSGVEGAMLQTALDSALTQLDWPQLQMPNTDDVKAAITNQFSGQARGSDTQRLQKTLNQVRQEIYRRLLTSFDEGSKPVFKQLKKVRTTLHTTLSAALEEALEQARRDLANKEQQLARYTALHQELSALLGG